MTYDLSDNEGPVVDPSSYTFSDDEEIIPPKTTTMIVEPALINGVTLNIPVALYQLDSLSKALLPAFEKLPDSAKALLHHYLPTLEGQENNEAFKNECANLLLSETPFFYGTSPLTTFHNRLRGAYYHPRLVNSRSRLLQVQELIYKQRCREHHLNQVISIIDTKYRLLVPQPKMVITEQKLPPKPTTTTVKHDQSPAVKIDPIKALMSRMTQNFEPLQQMYPASFIIAIRDTLLSLPSHSCSLDLLIDYVMNELVLLTITPQEVARMALFYLASPPSDIIYIRWVERTSLDPDHGEWRWVGPVEPPSQQYMAKVHVDFLNRCCSASPQAHAPTAEYFTRMSLDALKTKSPQTITPYSPDMCHEYQWQEVERYRYPERSFTFVIRGDRFPVAPALRIGSRVRTGVSAVKAREHVLLIADRPSSATVVSCVRDAASRLPLGVGTRADIVALILASQYVKTDEDTARSVVSGALDRLQGEADPCVKYESSNHLWIYLHHFRTEQMMKQPMMGSAKRKKGGEGRDKKKKNEWESDDDM
ncbi:hypothetical protein RCL1_002389 [Eukaryota sp. TZLM3-RCL]